MSGRAVRDSVTCAEEIISRLDDLRIQAITERSHFYVGAVCGDASKALRELKREVEDLRVFLRGAATQFVQRAKP